MTLDTVALVQDVAAENDPVRKESHGMKKEEKATAIAELAEKFGRAKLAMLTECAGFR